MKKMLIFALMFSALTMLFLATAPATAQQFKYTQTLTGHTKAVYTLRFKDNSTLISGSSDETLRAWNVTTGKQRWSRDVGNQVNAVAIPSHNPSFVAYGGPVNFSIRMRNTTNGSWRGKVAGHTAPVMDLAFRPNSYRLASASNDKTIKIWDVGTTTNMQHIRTLTGHTNGVTSVVWSPDGSFLASGGYDKTVRIWNPDTGTTVKVLKAQDSVYSVAWSRDGLLLASTGADKTVRIWNPDTGQTVRILSHSGSLSSVAFQPNGQLIATGNYGDHKVRLWNPNIGQLKATFADAYAWGHMNKIAFSPNGQFLAASAPNYRIKVWESPTLDVTGNGVVDVNDLVEVAKNFGRTVADGANRKADVNGDGTVDMEDLVAVAEAVEASGGIGEAPMIVQPSSGLPFTAADVQQWIHDAKAMGVKSHGITALEQLLTMLTRPEAPPEKTMLLTNYPNPFNPETWIPYQLAKPADVTVAIHTADGKLVRTLALGQLPAGIYQDKDRAAYWDGKNEQGESVASGVYFYTLKADDFSTTKKMLIRK